MDGTVTAMDAGVRVRRVTVSAELQEKESG